MSSGVGRRLGLDLALLWLWGRPVATALITPLAWEPLYATGAALQKAKKKTKKNLEFPSWHSGSESDLEPRGCVFDPRPRSVG